MIVMKILRAVALVTLMTAVPLVVPPKAMAQQAVPANDAALLRALQAPAGDISGRISIPDRKAAVLQHPEGREWREFREGTLKAAAGGLLLAVVAGLALFYAVRGRIRIDAGPSGRTITRFGGLDRYAHWLTASSFIVLGLSGLNLIFGRTLVLPLVGPEAFATLTEIGKFAHNFLSFPFVLGIVLMFVLWVKDNIPNALDVAWISQAGGLFSKGKHPPAKRFNAGQKVIFWLVVLGGAAMSVTGYMLMFPFYATGVDGMQLMHMLHALIAAVMVAGIIGHIYIGSVGMEGAFDAMGSGEVDVNWAREHHSLWLQEEMARQGKGAKVQGGHVAPAE
ncbi:formate dehydrogenase subunit gamma [Arenibaculum pallidiluteum]|uniref:formate dehydrogenase subunit gamma n=1 Tax=Arenibaculum pallidiluteum TaxID=2812559 RepID=UPI001A966236|nr:formate dehydrogenase subunit gamma [Arenibaculum pallidiluteum]